MRRVLSWGCLVCGVWSGVAEAAPLPQPTAVWLGTQLLPSPQMVWTSGAARFGVRWQLTPLLYAFGQHPGLSPWRSLVVEPRQRHGGSIELFVSPELLLGPEPTVIVRPGLRAYVPVVEHGEYLSLSLATSYQRIYGHEGVSLEAGAYLLFGILGLQLTWTPGPEQPVPWMITARVRYF
jgi:hypothetical protein